MKISLAWLGDYVDLAGQDPEELGRTLTLHTAEVEGVEEVEGQTVIEVDNKSLTHRPDLWGHVGFAREVAAILGRPFRHPVAAGGLAADEPDGSGLVVRVEAPELCPRYTAVVIDDIAGTPSPDWLTARLAAVGVRAISLPVDLTNYVMLELGQPLHAFDLAKLRGPAIVVRRARPGETITTLDGVGRKLTSDDLVIADAEAGIALAGVMGSAGSEIDESTRTMVLESANFDPVACRLTATRVGLRTEAVMRFEKSLDPALPPVAARRFVELLKRLRPEARVRGELHDVAVPSRPPLWIDLDTDFVRRRLGVDLPVERIDAILSSLEFGVVRGDAEHATIGVPSFRATKDVSTAEDLVEELGRIHGYDNIPPLAPRIVMEPRQRNELRLFERRAKQHLSAALGFDEVMLYTFQSSRGIRLFGLNPARLMKLANPLSEESAFLKRDLLPDLMLLVEKNTGLERFRLFEYGRTFHKDPPDARGALPREERRLAALVYDRSLKEGAQAFFDIKGALDGLLSRLGLATASWRARAAADLRCFDHPGRAAVVAVGEDLVGVAGELHPRVMKELGAPGMAAYFDVDLERLAALPGRAIAFEELPRFPIVRIDLSIACPERVSAASLLDLAGAVPTAHRREISIIALFRGGSLAPGEKSVTLRLVYRSDERTLTDVEVLAERDHIIAAVKAAGYSVR